MENTLASVILDKEIVLDNVIACAASNEDNELVSIFLYPRPGATNIKFYENNKANADKNNFEDYDIAEAPLLDVFNGFLKKFEVAIDNEKWVLVSFEEEGKVHISNPIRIKVKSKPTEYISSNVAVDVAGVMPVFSWKDGIYDDTKIYFQVLADNQNNLISGTYTFEKLFKFYNLENVVLNITPGTPVGLKPQTNYSFSLLAVSEDNWVNLFSVKEFSP
jgi:hypothetical protein